jgi:hypothetical protein
VDWYVKYCKDNGIPRKYGRSAERHKKRIKRTFDKANSLESVDLSSFSTREEAEEALFKKASGLGLTSTIFFTIISWLIQQLLNGHFGDNDK